MVRAGEVLPAPGRLALLTANHQRASGAALNQGRRSEIRVELADFARRDRRGTSIATSGVEEGRDKLSKSLRVNRFRPRASSSAILANGPIGVCSSFVTKGVMCYASDVRFTICLSISYRKCAGGGG